MRTSTSRSTNRIDMHITLKEFDTVCEGDLPDGRFDDLLDFILENDYGMSSLMSLTSIKSRGRALRARNHVGVISFRDGTTIEILPKIGDHLDDDSIRTMLVRMLMTVNNIPFTEQDISRMDSARMNPFEFLIRMFIREVDLIVRDGMCRSYNDVHDNEPALRGRIDFTENIKRNYAHRERLCQEYQILDEDRAENRLIRSTLDILYLTSTDQGNRRDLNRLLSWFEIIGPSVNVERDLDAVRIDRGMEHYIQALKWCRVFLDRRSMTSSKGHNVSMAFLFPMDVLYERYIARICRRISRGRFNISTQDASRRLFDERYSPQLRPDIVLRDGDRTIILDTKWKRVSGRNDVSMADLYQMYAYSKRFGTERVVLLYPYIGLEGWEYTDSVNGVSVDVRFIDMMHPERSVDEVMESLIG